MKSRVDSILEGVAPGGTDLDPLSPMTCGTLICDDAAQDLPQQQQ